jgi:hypothetical protein
MQLMIVRQIANRMADSGFEPYSPTSAVGNGRNATNAR